MADKVTATGADSKFHIHPADQYVAQCVDVIDLGQRVEDFTGKPKKLSPKCALVFSTGERNPDTQEPMTVSAEFTVSLGEKANLRRFMETWRGKPYTDEQIEAGVEIDKMEGQWSLITVAHKRSGAGRDYAVISSAVGVPKAMRDSLPTLPPYRRPDFWATKKEEYAMAARAFRMEQGAPPTDDDYSQAPPHDDDDDLPF